MRFQPEPSEQKRGPPCLHIFVCHVQQGSWVGASHQSLCHIITLVSYPAFFSFFQNEINILNSIHSFGKRKIVFKEKDTMKSLPSIYITLYPVATPWLINNFSSFFPVSLCRYKQMTNIYSYFPLCLQESWHSVYLCLYL